MYTYFGQSNQQHAYYLPINVVCPVSDAFSSFLDMIGVFFNCYNQAFLLFFTNKVRFLVIKIPFFHLFSFLTTQLKKIQSPHF